MPTALDSILTLARGKTLPLSAVHRAITSLFTSSRHAFTQRHDWAPVFHFFPMLFSHPFVCPFCLQPTHDDITYESIAEAFGETLAVHEETRERMTQHYAKQVSEISQFRVFSDWPS